ncbi:MAG: hypothetical protein M3N22_03630 [Acidobacteriota bacterium]|nr:hypothetical protein [Acidobacteriota bacterium]
MPLQTLSPAPLRLVRFPSDQSPVSNRDLALAWQTLSGNGGEAAVAEAASYLRKAVLENPEDPSVLAAMAYVEQRSGSPQKARDLYERALRIDGNLNDAATNLGVIEAQSGHPEKAAILWKGAFERAPSRSSSGFNLGLRKNLPAS